MIADEDELGALLDVAYPDTELRPGSPIVAQWYGRYADGRLVACAADRTFASPEPDAVPTGVIGAVAVHPQHRGRGLGAAAQLYHRIGFTGQHGLASVRPIWTQPP